MCPPCIALVRLGPSAYTGGREVACLSSKRAMVGVLFAIFVVAGWCAFVGCSGGAADEGKKPAVSAEEKVSVDEKEPPDREDGNVLRVAWRDAVGGFVRLDDRPIKSNGTIIIERVNDTIDKQVGCSNRGWPYSGIGLVGISDHVELIGPGFGYCSEKFEPEAVERYELNLVGSEHDNAGLKEGWHDARIIGWAEGWFSKVPVRFYYTPVKDKADAGVGDDAFEKSKTKGLINLAKRCDYKAVESIFKRPQKVTRTDLDAALAAAARSGCYHTTELLLKKGADAKSLAVSIALAANALRGNWNLSRLLHSHEATVAPLERAPLKALAPPLREDDDEASMAFLLELSPCVLSPEPESSVTAEDLKTLRYLKRKQKCLRLALHSAVERCRLPVVKSLLAAGYDPNRKDDQGRIPLRRFDKTSCPENTNLADEIERLLLEAGAIQH